MYDILKISELSQFTIHLIDILLVTLILYHIYSFFKHTRAMPVFIGLGLLIFLGYLAKILKLETSNWLVEITSSYLIIAVLITLQPELRRIFSRLGEISQFNFLLEKKNLNISIIIDACLEMKKTRTGSLLVFLNKTGLNQIIENGVLLNAKLSMELLIAIFFKDNPLHDGATLIRNNQIVSAATYLPISNSKVLKKTHGSRHRAALGISEESDALVIIVSEEKKNISACYQGDIKENIDASYLKKLLLAYNLNNLYEVWNLREISKK